MNEGDGVVKVRGPREWGLAAITVGATAMVGGLAVDAWEHARDPGLAAREGIFTFSNVGHALLYAGVVLIILGLAVSVFGSSVYGPMATAGRTLRVAVPLSALVLVGGTTTALGQSSLAKGHDDGHDHEIDGTAITDHHEHFNALPAIRTSTRRKLAAQLDLAREASARFPTVGDAQAAGLVRGGGLLPGSGVHYSRGPRSPSGTFDPLYPEQYVYAGDQPSSPLVALMYLGGGEEAPVGFAGPFDVWHKHANVCVVFRGTRNDVLFPIDRDTSREECLAADPAANFVEQTTFMVHVWLTPGWENPLGLFAHDHPGIVCADGSFTGNERGYCPE